ncbi:DUF861 domain-containing protein [Sphingomonas histidinilytica]|uniref:cupin domain-containing protein n=1 Tax=Rhizorhabdus histidinilytica TaxID=439228 RepID=UPI001ADA1669|nr:cupin domain-containing protein [Rhizorhabdus histidinilytica]MBO9378873.1 DUF861 domain-containing protein [Rhizorhabdus histidinilytica]
MSVKILTPETGDPITPISEGWEVIEGNPVLWAWFEHTSEDGKLIEGTWRCTPGTFRAEYKYYEFVVMIEGVIEITPDGGETVVVRGGDAFAVEADFKGTWKIVEPVHKRFLVRLA